MALFETITGQPTLTEQQQTEIPVRYDEYREETWTDIRQSLPALARAPSRFDRTLYRLERGELVVRTEPVDGHRVSDRGLGYAVLAGALVVAAAILTFHDRPYSPPQPAFSSSISFDVGYRDASIRRLLRGTDVGLSSTWTGLRICLYYCIAGTDLLYYTDSHRW